METGIDPVNWLLEMLKPLILGRVIPMSNGRRPWNWLSPTSNVFNEDGLKTEGGIVPDNLFPATRKFESLVNWPKESEIIPPKLFSDTINHSRNERFPKEGGILPVKLFLLI